MDIIGKSRTQRKYEDRALKNLVQELVDLSPDQLQHVHLPDEILDAIRLARKITRHGARRRQIQRIRALLREADGESIRNSLETIKRGDDRQALAFKRVEKWRDELRGGNRALIEEILTLCPGAERQRLTQLARNANKEYLLEKGVKSSRALFRYLSRISESLSFPESAEE